MSQQLRAASLLRQAADLLNVEEKASSVAAPTATAANIASNIASSTRAIFAPYRTGRRRGISRAEAVVAVSHWTHKFCIIPNCNQETVPSREEKYRLHHAGLGEKRITFVKSTNKTEFEKSIEDAYPKLRNCGGYELMRTPPGSRVALENILMPVGGYTSAYLADDSTLGQAMCYIRPIQKDLDTEKLRTEPCEPCQECLTCGNMIPVNVLREHVEMCIGIDDADTTAVVNVKRRKVSSDRPICGFACKQDHSSAEQDIEPAESSKKELGLKEERCPICCMKFSVFDLEEHAATCGEKPYLSKVVTESGLSLDEDVEAALKEVEKKPNAWRLSVVRSNFLTTATEELKFGQESDWLSPFRVSFLGEEGIDNGGPRREFFTLLFNSSPVFEGKSFSVNSEFLANREYVLLGKATALAILNGHPGPRRFYKHIVNYILTGTEPDMDDELEIDQSDVRAALQVLQSDSDIGEAEESMLDMLGSAGFKKQLSATTRVEANKAITRHYGFYMYMGPLLQYMEGLKLHGVLDMLRKYKEASMDILLFTDQPVLAEVSRYFEPSYSCDDSLKAKEVMIVYNFNKFLKEVDRKLVTCSCLGEEDNIINKTVSLKDVLIAFVGCENLPRNTGNGLITFDHSSDRLSTVNTCGPSVTFSNLNKIKDYEEMKVHMLNIVIGAPEFGME